MANVSFGSGIPAAGIVTPATGKVTLNSNYLDIRSDGWTKQYLPELYASEVEKYGDRSIGGFLDFLSAEEAMTSDQVIWSEQGRLHIAYQATCTIASGAITAIKDIDNTGGANIDHSLRVGNTLVCVIGGVVFKAYVKTAGASPVIKPYGAANVTNVSNTISGGAATQTIKMFVYGSDFGKGTASMAEAVEPKFQSYKNSPMIIKDHFEISGSDAAQIGWVEVSGEAGQNGFLWYVKSEADTRKRYEDYLEMAMVEAEASASAADADIPAGSDGLFKQINQRGLTAATMFDDKTETIADFTTLLKELDKQGSIEENTLFLDRDSNINVDDALAGLNPHVSGGLGYGLFNNSEDMALNLGFTGFRRGSYDFYKTDWKYLNDASTRGLVGGVAGVLIPAGTTSVYDQSLGRNMRRPFLHVRYRASETDNRKMKTWVTGSVGAATSGDDKMEVHYLSERCLVVQAANNFVLFNS
jgi:hypothetical protein